VIETDLDPEDYAEGLHQRIEKGGKDEVQQIEKWASKPSEKEKKGATNRGLDHRQNKGPAANVFSRESSQRGREKIAEIELKSLEYIHLKRNNGNERVEVGPNTIMISEKDMLTRGPSPYISIPKGQRCLIMNPVMRDEKNGSAVRDANGEYLVGATQNTEKIAPPLPLLPGEKFMGGYTKGYYVPDGFRLHLRNS
jgi:hypothetical protein